MDRRFLSILTVIILIFVGIFIANQHKNNSTGQQNTTTAKASNHIVGKGAKKVTLIEYGDYECPICYAYYPTVKQVADANSANIYFQFRNLPLVSVHKNAFASARAAEAAGLQNKFWEMHDKLYDNQDPSGQSGWVASGSPLTFFDNFAKEIGLNVSQFDKDYASSQVNDIINADLDAFKKTGQPEATPSFFLNGKYVDNSLLTDSNHQPSVSKFQSVLDAEMAKAH